MTDFSAGGTECTRCGAADHCACYHYACCACGSKTHSADRDPMPHPPLNPAMEHHEDPPCKICKADVRRLAAHDS